MFMRKLLVLGFSVLLASPVVAGDDDELEFKARLSGDNEVPPVDTDTDGRAVVEFSEDGNSLEFKLKVNDGRRITQAHIHCGPEGVNGPVVVFLAGNHPLGLDVDGNWVRNATATDESVRASIGHPNCPIDIRTIMDVLSAALDGNAYVNVHSVENPGGEIRGQLVLEEEDDDDDD